MNDKIIHPNIKKVTLKIKDYILVDGKLEETEREIQLPKSIVANYDADKPNKNQ